MIFLAAATEPTIVLMLSEQDVNNMRGGRTVFVDQRQVGKNLFSKVIISLHPTNEAALEMLHKAGHKPMPGGLIEPAAQEEKEGTCKGCQGIMLHSLLLDDMCMPCWREEALIYKRLYKGETET